MEEFFQCCKSAVDGRRRNNTAILGVPAFLPSPREFEVLDHARGNLIEPASAKESQQRHPQKGHGRRGPSPVSVWRTGRPWRNLEQGGSHPLRAIHTYRSFAGFRNWWHAGSRNKT